MAAIVKENGKIDLAVRIKRFNPEAGDESWWDEFDIEMEPNDRWLVEKALTREGE